MYQPILLCHLLFWVSLAVANVIRFENGSPLSLQTSREVHDCQNDPECKCRHKGCVAGETKLTGIECSCPQQRICCIKDKEQGCISDFWNKDSGQKEKAPLILKKLTDSYALVLPEKAIGSNKKRQISVNNNDELIITCPGKDNKFENDNIKDKEIEVICTMSKLKYNNKPVEIKDLGCNVLIMDSAEVERKGKDKVKCSENSKKWYKYKIGFKLESDFFTLIEVCFDEIKKTTVWTRHSIYGENMKAHSNRKRRDFADKEEFFGKIKMKEIYRGKDQWENFIKLLNDKNFINKERRNLEKGHLSPVADFVLRAEMLATNYFINAVPMWHSINQGNWQILESVVRKFAEKEGHILTITSGTHGVLKSNKEQLFLADSEKVPVPQYLWKVVQLDSEAVAFVVINDPFLEDDPKSLLCEDRCGDIKFINADYAFNNFNANLRHNRCFGYTYCCKITDKLRKTIPSIPGKGDMDLLDENRDTEVEE